MVNMTRNDQYVARESLREDVPVEGIDQSVSLIGQQQIEGSDPQIRQPERQLSGSEMTESEELSGIRTQAFDHLEPFDPDAEIGLIIDACRTGSEAFLDLLRSKGPEFYEKFYSTGKTEELSEALRMPLVSIMTRGMGKSPEIVRQLVSINFL